MFPALLICALMVKNAATQTVTISLGITKSCVLIGDDVKLLCTVSSGCCTSQSRIWEKGSAVSLLNDGVPPVPSTKYVEVYDGVGTTGFNLIIKNVQKSDLGLNYKCVYGLQSSELYLDGILCSSSEVNISGNCLECAGKDYGWSILGTVIGTVIILIIAKVKIDKTKTVLIVGGLPFIISAVVNIPVAVLIGYYMCHCVDETDWLLILLGLCTSLIIGVITLMYMLKPGCCKVLIALCAVGSCICCICYTFTGKESKQDGDQELNKKDEKDEKSQPLAK